MLVSILFWGMWCFLVCHPHLTTIPCCTAVWAQACGLDHKNKFRHFHSSLVHTASRNCFYLVVGLLVVQYHDTATSGIDYVDLHNIDNLCSLCAGNHVRVSRYCRFGARRGDGRSTPWVLSWLVVSVCPLCHFGSSHFGSRPFHPRCENLVGHGEKEDENGWSGAVLSRA